MTDFDDLLQAMYPPPPKPDSTYCELSIAIVLAPQFTMTPLAGLLDVLRLAADEADYSRQVHCQWTVLGDHVGQPISSSSGISVNAMSSYAQQSVKNYHYVAVIGGLLPQTFSLSDDGYRFIHTAYQQGVKVIGICVGSFILARLGLLDDKKCAVGFGHEKEMNILFPKVKTYTDRLYHTDDNIITCPGGVATIDLANRLVANHCGEARSVKTKRTMLVANTRKVSEFPTLNVEHARYYGDWQIQRAIEYMQNNLSDPIPIKRLAKTIGVSQTALNKSFSRLFDCSPTQVWQRLRMEHAQWLLINTNKHIAVISDECGFYDASYFTKSYKRFFGTTPQKTRQDNQNVLSIDTKATPLKETILEKITRYRD